MTTTDPAIDPSTSQLAEAHRGAVIETDSLPIVNTRPMALLQDAIRRGADIGVIKEISALAEHWQSREAEIRFNEAFNECQGELQPVLKDTQGEKGKYAPLEKIALAIRPIIIRHGFGTTVTEIFSPDVPAGNCRIELSLRHRSGHAIKCTSDFALDMAGAKGIANKTEIQGKGSTLSYARRYLLVMAFDIIIVKEMPKAMPQPDADPDAPQVGTREQNYAEQAARTSPKPETETPVTKEQIDELAKRWQASINAKKPTTAEEKMELANAFAYFCDKALGFTEPSSLKYFTTAAWTQATLKKCMEGIK